MFDSHVKSLCKKASQKLIELSRVAYQSDFNQRKLLMNPFITSQFSHDPVVWMFHNRKQNHHISYIHEKALRVVYKEHNFSFDELLEKDNSCKIHDKNLQKLVTKIFIVKMKLAPEITKEVFEILEGPYALRNEPKLKTKKKITFLGMTLKQYIFFALESGAVYPVTFNNVNHLRFSSQRSKI